MFNPMVLYFVFIGATVVYQLIWKTTVDNRALMAANESWLNEGRTFAMYKEAFPQHCANGKALCNKCSAAHTKMFVQGSSYASSKPLAIGVHSFSGWVRYRSHICGRCGAELYRSKGV